MIRKKSNGEGLPILLIAMYNDDGGTPEDLLDNFQKLQEELVRAGVFPEDYEFEGHRELVDMQLGKV